jgi:hypothetical protein
LIWIMAEGAAPIGDWIEMDQGTRSLCPSLAATISTGVFDAAAMHRGERPIGRDAT